MEKTEKKQKSLLQAMERVVELSKDSQLSKDFFRKAKKEIKQLADSYGITERQAVFFCVCMERGPRRVDYDDLAHHLEVSKIHMLSYAEDIDALVRRRLIRYRDAQDEEEFDVPVPVIKALKHNEPYTLPKRTGLDCFELFEVISQLFEDLDDDALAPKALYEELQALFNDNPQVDFVRKMKAISIGQCNFLLLMIFCHLLVNKDDDDIRFGQIEDVFDTSAEFNNAKSAMRSDEHFLIRNGYIEHVCEDGIASPTRYKLTESTKRYLLSELKLNTTDEKIADVIKVKDLKHKEMFYVETNRSHVEELKSFLQPDKYKEIHERMQQSGFRTGFACLFYGGPGTGKTETAYQLALATGRDIMVVDVPQIKSKWVGDSEKNIKALFDRYRELVKKNSFPRGDGEGVAPILLFNEADAIIGIRKQGATSAVDKMENSIQNIILQEMETLDGIMIATTNLTENLDTAFERRFLYKIKFEKPDANVRSLIWRQMIPELTEADAIRLAEAYDFSGGQIENVARKQSINTILHGNNTNMLETLSRYCDQERLETKQRKIGF